MSFNKWKDEYGLEFEPNYSKETELDCKAAFKAGQQSKQAEIDDLKKRIEDALNMLCKLQYSDGDRIYKEVTRILNNK